MRKTINKTHIEGKIYDFSLAEKKVQNESSPNYGKDFINGTIDIATDNDNMNIVTVHYSYEPVNNKSGKKNSKYTALKNIIDNGKTVLNDGADNATLVKIDSALGLNDFYTNRDGEEVLVSAKRNEGGFITFVTKIGDEATRSTFEMDMLINGTRIVEANEERNIPEDYMVIKGAVFDFRGAILPVEFNVKNSGGIKYFESLDITSSNPVFTKVWGQIVSKSTVDKRTEESAWGEPIVKEYPRTFREWLVIGTSKPDAVYEIGDDKNGITADEIKKALADREVYLAGVKKSQEEYQASKNANNNALPFAEAPKTAQAGSFNF